MLRPQTTFLLLALLFSVFSAEAEIVYNKPGQRAAPKFGCAPGTEVYGDPEKREKRVMCVAPVRKDRYVKHGMYMSFDDKKELRKKGLYYEDKKHGRWTDFDRYGRKKQQDDYEYGKLMKSTIFDEDGNGRVKFDAQNPKSDRSKSHAKKKPEKVFLGLDQRPL